MSLQRVDIQSYICVLHTDAKQWVIRLRFAFFEGRGGAYSDRKIGVVARIENTLLLSLGEQSSPSKGGRRGGVLFTVRKVRFVLWIFSIRFLFEEISRYVRSDAICTWCRRLYSPRWLWCRCRGCRVFVVIAAPADNRVCIETSFRSVYTRVCFLRVNKSSSSTRAPKLIWNVLPRPFYQNSHHRRAG